ncbi:acetyl esterase [Novosphingobium hassiacum]|uniref:Acetyl esterase n=1 Tax=Novosphingobium hassiacum TaxID=173676 RepID=A0A7W5ZZ16_9SPHN|nr:alpha/beta hydrolase [Novosphingobium hassiacum]MBB3860902.1 acetyl esterase [Novosphingobium hassiacum]
MADRIRRRRALFAASGALVFGGIKLARELASSRSVANLLDGSGDQSARAQDLLSRPVVQKPLTAGARLLGKLIEATTEVRPPDAEAQKKPRPRATAMTRMIGGVPVRGVHIEDRAIPGRECAIPVRIYTPELSAAVPRPLVVVFHGGGWSAGDLNGTDWIASTVARDLDAIVVSVDYRLSPLHPFPAGVNDCFDALKWAAAKMTELGAEAGRIGIMGQSAGGNLAAVASLLAREEGGPEIHHQALIYPSVDLVAETRSYVTNSNAPMLDLAAIRAFIKSYLGGNSGEDWRFSPLRAPDLRGLPPALIQIAGHDPLYDDGILYSKALSQADVPVRLTAYAAMPHGFVNLPYFCRDARAAIQEVVAEQRRFLSVSRPRQGSAGNEGRPKP